MKTSTTQPAVFTPDPFSGRLRPTPNASTAPYQRHSATSRAAAQSVQSRAKSQEAQALKRFAYATHAGLTDEELYSAMVSGGDVPATTKDSSIRRARVGLVNRGMVRDSGRSRAGRSGKRLTVWVVVTAA